MPSGGRQEDPPANPFVRFKNHVDSSIASGFNTMFGSPQRDEQSSTVDMSSGPNAHGIFSLQNVLDSRYYSPTSLRGLPRPTPSDLPAHLLGDATIFTFEDAFEDLLAMTQGQPLPDIEHRYSQRKLLRQMFPDGEPRWFFERRLHTSGLFRIPTVSPPQQQQQHRRQSDGAPDWDDFHRQLEERAAEMWGRHQEEQRSDGLGNDSASNPGLWTDNILGDTVRLFVRLAGEDESRKVMSEVKKAFENEFGSTHGRETESRSEGKQQQQLLPQLDDGMRMMARLFDEEGVRKNMEQLEEVFEKTLRDEREQKESALREGQHQQHEGRRSLPDTFDELFSHVKSAFDSGERSWKAFTKTIANQEEEALPGHGLTKHVDHDDHVDEYGNTHHKTTVRVFDHDGNEVSKYTTHQVFHNWESPKSDASTSTVVGGQLSESDKKADRNAWFWK